MGFKKTNMEALINLIEQKSISSVTASFLQDTRAWIVTPKQIIIETSVDGKNFTEVFNGNNFLAIDDLNVQVKKVTSSFSSGTAQYIK